MTEDVEVEEHAGLNIPPVCLMPSPPAGAVAYL